MCGIIAILGDEILEEDTLDAHLTLIDSRGLDYKSDLIECKTKCCLLLRLKAAILHMRGSELQKQPVIDSEENILLFNGQIYEYNSQPLHRYISDTYFIAEKLGMCKTAKEVSHVFSCIDGPFAFIYWHNNLNSLFFGRDIFGRKSLCKLSSESLISNEVQCLAISSIAKQVAMKLNRKLFRWSEVDCSGLHCLEFDIDGSLKNSIKYPWNLDHAYPTINKCASIEQNTNSMLCPFKPLNQDLKLYTEFNEEKKQKAIDEFKKLFTQAILKRTKLDRKICLECRKVSDYMPHSCRHSKVAVAFSGGIDSTLIALVLNQVVDPTETIDLITVAFKSESPDRISVGEAFKELCSLCPKRRWRLVVCDVSVSELIKERNSTIGDLITPCNKVIDDSLGCACWFIARGKGRALENLVEDTDFTSTLEKFLQFNYQCYGANSSSAVNFHYISPAVTFFVGSGIDEQLGGYSSHKAAWQKRGVLGVYEEISLQMRRIPERNLGRDDRIYAHHCRDVKLPYLDTQLVNFLNQLPVGLKMNLNESSDIGPKKLLRELAHVLGLKETSRRIKRALQFGTRIANLEHSKEKGNDICSRLINHNDDLLSAN